MLLEDIAAMLELSQIYLTLHLNCANLYEQISTHECRICQQGTKILAPEALWFLFVVRVVLTSHVFVGLGCTSPCGELQREKALAEIQS